MLKLKRVFEAAAIDDSSHTSIMFNMADSLKKKGWDVAYNDRLGMTVNFDFTGIDPKKSAEGKAWLKENPGKTFVFKAGDKKGFFQWNVEKQSDGSRVLTTKNVTVGRDNNLNTLQKKLNAPKVDGKLTGKSPKPFTKVENVPVTNMVTPTFQSFLKKFRDKIIMDAALALCEVVEEPVKKESYSSSKYFIEYDHRGNRINEGYISESDNDPENKENKKEPVDWNNKEVQDEVVKAIKGIKIDTGKTNKDKLIFTYNGKNGSLRLQGYMLVLDLDTDDDVPPTNYPVKDKNNLSVKNLLDTVKVVFSRRESLNKITENYSNFDSDIQSDENDPIKPEPMYYILTGDPEDPSVGLFEPTWNEIIGDEEGYSTKSEAMAKARELAKSSSFRKPVGVTYGPVDITYFMYDTFWDAIDDEKIKIDQVDVDPVEEEHESNNDCDSDNRMTNESIEDHTQFHDSESVFNDVAKERFLSQLSDSLIIAPECKGECMMQDRDPNTKVIWVYLSPSYAISRLSDILVPICLKGNTLSMPMADMPSPDAVFDGNYTSDSMNDYDTEVQNFIMNDAPLSDLMELDLDNADDAKARVVDVINSMSEDYQDKRNQLADALDLSGDDLLKESRYFLIPAESEPNDMTIEEIKEITPMGFTDLDIARDSVKEFSDSGKYTYGLGIIDTHFSNNKEKWEKL